VPNLWLTGLTLWVKCPLWVSHLDQLSLPSLWVGKWVIIHVYAWTAGKTIKKRQTTATSGCIAAGQKSVNAGLGCDLAWTPAMCVTKAIIVSDTSHGHYRRLEERSSWRDKSSCISWKQSVSVSSDVLCQSVPQLGRSDQKSSIADSTAKSDKCRVKKLCPERIKTILHSM